MQSAMIRFLYSILSLLLLASCASVTVDPNDPNAHLIQGVPMIRQAPMQCGAASLAMVLNFYGFELSQGDIWNRTPKSKSGGLTCMTMYRFASNVSDSLMQTTSMVSKDPAKIKSYLDKDMPVIASVIAEGPQRNCHYVVVVGYTADGFIINDPMVGVRFVNYGAFRKWHNCDFFSNCPPYWLLVVMSTE
jgi:ABC-type bacteriocin/lantibiotic exporter with double-glycine peptidase domain